MFDFEYKKLWNSQENTDKLFDELTIDQQNQLNDLLNRLHQDLTNFGDKSSNAFSIVLHVMTHKVALVPVTKLRLMQLKPYQKNDNVPPPTNGQVDW